MHFIGSAPLESLSLWERWHCEAMTERASPARKSRCAAMGRLFVSAKRALHLCFPASGLTLSGASRQLSQRESLWQAGQVSSGRAKLICFVDCSALLSRPAALPSQALRASSPKGRALGRPGHFSLTAGTQFSESFSALRAPQDSKTPPTICYAHCRRRSFLKIAVPLRFVAQSR